MSRGEKIITINNLSVRYDSVVALEHVDLDIFDNDFIGIIGPNGGGKSTLAKIIAGIIKPTSGQILLDGLLRKEN